MGLFKPAWMTKDSYNKKAEKAVEAETNQEVLLEIIKKAPLVNIRRIAVIKLTDQATLTDIARKKYDHYWTDGHQQWMRAAAASCLIEKSIVIDIALNDGDFEVRVAAVKNKHLTDQTILAQIAKSDDTHLVRIEAVRKITDQSIIEEIAKTEKDIQVLENIFSYFRICINHRFENRTKFHASRGNIANRICRICGEVETVESGVDWI